MNTVFGIHYYHTSLRVVYTFFLSWHSCDIGQIRAETQQTIDFCWGPGLSLLCLAGSLWSSIGNSWHCRQLSHPRPWWWRVTARAPVRSQLAQPIPYPEECPGLYQRLKGQNETIHKWHSQKGVDPREVVFLTWIPGPPVPPPLWWTHLAKTKWSDKVGHSIDTHLPGFCSTVPPKLATSTRTLKRGEQIEDTDGKETKAGTWDSRPWRLSGACPARWKGRGVRVQGFVRNYEFILQIFTQPLQGNTPKHTCSTQNQPPKSKSSLKSAMEQFPWWRDNRWVEESRDRSKWSNTFMLISNST